MAELKRTNSARSESRAARTETSWPGEGEDAMRLALTRRCDRGAGKNLKPDQGQKADLVHLLPIMNLHPIIANRKSTRGPLHGHITPGIRKFEMGTVGMEEPPDRLSVGVSGDKGRDLLQHIAGSRFDLRTVLHFRVCRCL